MLRSRVSNRMSRSRALSRASNQTKSKDPGASTSSQSNGQASFQNIAPINNQVEIRNQLNRVPMASSLTTSCRAICECRSASILLQTNEIRGPAWDMGLRTNPNLQWNWDVNSRPNTLSVGRDSRYNSLNHLNYRMKIMRNNFSELWS